MSVKAARVLISGRVQGVFFRHWTRDQAVRLGVKGWVRNCYGGDVEGHFEGPEAAVDGLIAACRQGPPMATVERVVVEIAELSGAAGFVVRPSA
ncbi:MAG: acylphosphatase [Proteobacteria bacterium]|nr:acylphosphatase [Pseudomonadota bacterium]